MVLLNIAFAIMALYFIFRGGVVTPASQPLEYKDFVSILLTALGVMIAVAALFVAFFAIWGYKSAKELISEIAEKAARDTAQSVALRTAFDSKTSAPEAKEIVDAVTGEAEGAR
jgi:hypothetical protein